MKKILQVLHGNPVFPPPVWFMRQAGRYLPEYREVRKNHDFLTMCRTPELAAEVTLQPISRYGFDASIIFSDILIPFPPMGLDVRFEEGIGPVVQKLTSIQQLRDLHVPDPSRELPFVMDAIRMVRNHLPKGCAMIGFAGAPFTLAAYAIEGGSSRNFTATKEWLYSDPESFRELLEKFADIITLYLESQVEAGAEVIQIFDTWGGGLTLHAFKEFAMFPVQKIVDRLMPHVPVIYYVLNGVHLYSVLPQIGCTCLGVDWRAPMNTAREMTSGKTVLQGNLDPNVLFSTRKSIQSEVDRILGENRGYPHVFNLGHGILPTTPVENVRLLLDYLRSLS